MRISEALARTRPFFSFEFFPPKDDEGERQLFATVESLAPLRPAFVSITYGAGGSTRSRTVELAKRIGHDLGLTVLAHVTCVGSTRAELRDLFDDLARAGIENILALRGDSPKGSVFTTPPTGFSHANELVAMLKRNYGFCIGAACYPQMHVEATSPQDDLAHLERKVAAGADFLITQLFFENDAYRDFERKVRGRGITVPMLPGIMPITNYAQIDRFSAMCGATIPPKLRVALEERRKQPEAVVDLGVAFATLQCHELLQRGAAGLHFYTLNRSPATRAILSALLAASSWQPIGPAAPVRS